jgi:hypothetical protein
MNFRIYSPDKITVYRKHRNFFPKKRTDQRILRSLDLNFRRLPDGMIKSGNGYLITDRIIGTERYWFSNCKSFKRYEDNARPTATAGTQGCTGIFMIFRMAGIGMSAIVNC